jgi:menaquinol-cytochrome c reductase iron-sulfur subunit
MTEPSKRRRFLNFCTKVLMATLGLFVAIPAIGYFVAPLLARREGLGAGGGFVDAGRLAELPVGGWHLLSLEMEHQDGWKKSRVRHSIWVRRQGKRDQDITVLSPICPHLGCPVNVHPKEGRFVCPCHGGVFNSDGAYVSGPPPRSMDPLDFEVRAGRLWVRWQDFKIGVARRIPVRT